MSPRSLRLLLAITAIGASPLTAQPRAGLHVGLNRGALIMDSGDSAWRHGLIAGGWVRFPLAGAVALQVGAYTSEKGGAETEGAIAGTGAIECLCSEVILKYIEFPLALSFLINRAGPTSGYIAAGGAFGLQRDCLVTAQEPSVEAKCEEEAAHVNTESWDVSLLLGGGVEFDRGPVIFTVDGRLTAGITEAITVIGLAPGADFDSNSGQHLSISLMAGVAFPLG